MGDVKLISSLCKSSMTMDHPHPKSSLPCAAPAFSLPPRNTRVKVGGTARIDGKVRGSPDPLVTWYRNGQPVQDSGRCVAEQSARGTFCLTIKEVNGEDGGKYTCEAANEEGVRQVTIEVIVEGSAVPKYALPSSSRSPGSPFGVPQIENRPSIWGESPPKFVTKPNRSVVTAGQTGRFSFKVTGRPQPSVTWHKDDVQLLSGGRFNMCDKSGVHYLEIQDVCKADAGNYCCTVENSCGRSSVCAELVVQGCDKTDRISSPLGGSVTPPAKPQPPVSSNGILKMHREAENRKSVESSSWKHEPNAEPVKVKSSFVSPVSSTTQRSRPRSGSPSASLRAAPSPITDTQTAASRPKPSEEPAPTSYAKAPTTRTARETPSVVSRYTSMLDPKDKSRVRSREAETKPSSEANPRSLDLKAKPPVEKEAKSGPPKAASSAVSSCSGSIESKVRSFQKTPEAQSPSPMETGSLASRSTRHNIGRHCTPSATTKVTDVWTSDSRKENVLPNGNRKLGSVRPADISATDGVTLADKSSMEASVSLRAKGETTFISIHDKTRDSAPAEPPLKTSRVATKETSLKSAQYIAPKPDQTKGAANTCQSTTNILLKKRSSPNPKPDVPNNIISGVHHGGPAAEVTSSGGVADGKYQQKSSSTITLKSVKILPTPETGRNVAGQKGDNVEGSKIRKVSLVSGDDQKGAAETDGSDSGTAPKFDLTPPSQEALEGSSVTFRCKVSGEPKPRVEWFKEGSRVEEKDGVEVREGSRIHSLHLMSARPRDGGSYSCEITNRGGHQTCSWTLTVKRSQQEPFGPRFDQVLEGRTVMEGQDFTLSCTVRGEPRPDVTWLLNERPIQYAHTTYEDGTAQLTVQDALPEDEGMYTCRAQSSAGSASCSTTVTTANPPAKVIWLHNGKEIQETEDFHFEQSGNTCSLYIQEVFPEDTGTYTCQAWNHLGQANTEFSSVILEPQEGTQPWFISKPKPLTLFPGQNALITCAIAGDPFPEVQWMKDGRMLVGCDVLQNEDVFTLILKSVTDGDAGIYTINLKNAVGECGCQVPLMLRESSAGSQFGEHREQLGFAERDGGVDVHRLEGVTQREDQETIHGVLKRRVEVKEHSEERLRQQEAEQVDFRRVLGRKVSTKSISEENLKEVSAEQMDFRANLQRQVKPKASVEDDKKGNSTQQVDFRSVLGKKGSVPPKTPVAEKAPAKVATPDFRSVLGSKKKGPTENGSANNVEPHENAKPFGDRLKSVAKDEKAKPAVKEENAKPAVNQEKAKTLDEKAKPAAKEEISKPEVKEESAKPPVAEQNAKPAVENAAPLAKEEKVEQNCVSVVDGEVENKAEESSGTPPVFSEVLQDLKLVDGEKLLLQCQVTSEPPPTATWTLDGKVIKSSKFIVLAQEGPLCTLTIEKTFPEDGGQYKCVAENSAGKAECSCNVSVEDTSGKTEIKKTKKPRSNAVPAGTAEMTFCSSFALSVFIFLFIKVQTSLIMKNVNVRSAARCEWGRQLGHVVVEEALRILLFSYVKFHHQLRREDGNRKFNHHYMFNGDS
ncbi:PREDICTED: myosin light chain kinase, smooth muscle-like [Nanorana parkeri]|uniref:myosin light chain kinase, smooth muscle-like n=1 Tax=Nanorana parkeri TaxID=125878 RepID=UPI000854C460|nr:PREDICTED: myosin light chain kinase, smooth muscle-like [Nanorana parkeri]